MLLERLERESGVKSERLCNLADTASKRYYIFEIDKRSGGRRQIAHPSRALKGVQRWLNARLLRKLPIHSAAMAYRKGISIRDNVIRHVGSQFTLRMDFKDFFPSFSEDGVKKFLVDQVLAGNCQLETHDVEFVGKIVSRYGQLTIGAPTSPMLTNAMMFDFDSKLQNYCEERAMIYTRYADDLFISATEPERLSLAKEFVLCNTQNFPYARLKINENKTAFLSRKYRRSITGLVLTPNDKISVGRHRKREIKALVYKYLNGTLEVEKLGYLKGLIAFVSDAEPEFRGALDRKYGQRAIMTIMRD